MACISPIWPVLALIWPVLALISSIWLYLALFGTLALGTGLYWLLGSDYGSPGYLRVLVREVSDGQIWGAGGH